MAGFAANAPRPGREGRVLPNRTEPTSTRPLDLYFQELGETKRLTAADELSLAFELRAGRQTLWNTLLDAPLGEVLETAFALLDPARRPNEQARRYARALADRRIREATRSTAREELVLAMVTADRDGLAARAVLEGLRETSDDRALLRRCAAASAAVARARNRFVAANLGLVIVLARRYERRHLGLADLIQEGNTGLIKAVDRFDPDRGFRFSTYAVWWIRHAIGRALSDKSREIRLPVHVAERQQTVLRARTQFEAREGRRPTVPELAAQTNFTEDRVADLLSVEYSRATATTKGSHERGLLDVDDIAGDRTLDDIDLDAELFEQCLKHGLDDLPGIQRDVLRQRFGLDGEDPRTLREVGETHALSRERIRQLQVRALETLKRAFERRGLCA